MLSNIPCVECPTYVMCKIREKTRAKWWTEEKFGQSIFELSHREDCPFLLEYLEHSDQDEINEVRALFGMEPYYK